MNVDSSAMGRVPSFGDRESGHSGALKAERQFSGALRPDTGRRLKGGFGREARIAYGRAQSEATFPMTAIGAR